MCWPTRSREPRHYYHQEVVYDPAVRVVTREDYHNGRRHSHDSRRVVVPGSPVKRTYITPERSRERVRETVYVNEPRVSFTSPGPRSSVVSHRRRSVHYDY